MAQYRRAAQARGYSPRRVDQSNIQRMREDSERTARNMRERAETEISDRRRVLAQQKEDQAATRRMEEKNYQIDSDNSRREIEGLRLKAQQESRQAALDIEASNAIFSTIKDFSDTALNVALQIKTEKQKEDHRNKISAARESGDYNGLFQLMIGDAAAKTVEQLGAVQRAELAGGADPLTVAKLKRRDPNQIARGGLAAVDAAQRDGAFQDYLFQGARRLEEQAGGRPL